MDTLVARYAIVESVKDVAREFHLTRQTAARHLAARGIETVRRMSEADNALAVQLYTNGDSAARIGQQLGFEPHTILKALRAAGIAIRPRRGQAPR